MAHSFSYQDAVFEVAAEAPKTNFAWAGGIGQTAANVSDYDQPFYEPAYLVGILAGHVSQSGHLGALYGFDIPVCHAMGEAMLAGAKTVNPEATLTVTAVGDWGDVSAAKEAAWPRSTPPGSTTGSAAARGRRSARSRPPKNGRVRHRLCRRHVRAGPRDRARQHRLGHGADLRPTDRADRRRQLPGRVHPLRRQRGCARHRGEPEARRESAERRHRRDRQARAAIRAGTLEVPFVPQ